MSGASKRKRQKLVELLVGSSAGWSSKASHQASQLMKLNKILLVCDANFLDEKTGESPLSLAIGSQQLAQATLSSLQQQNGQTINMQSASLFSLQSQHQLTNSIDSSMLRQTNIADLYHSRAPLIERLILLLVKSGAQIDFRNSDGRTPLHVAAMKSNFWALKTLLDLGASNDYRDINGLTPLYYSILHKADLKVTQLLLNHNRSSNAGYHSTPNHLAGVGNGRSLTIGVVDQHGWQEVHQACKLGLDAHLEKLLYYGCDIDAKISGSGNTPLHVAAINDQLNCAKVLLMRGANTNIINNSHQTAHQVAVISNNMDLAEFIAEHNESKVIPFTYDIAARRSTAASGTTITTTSSTTNGSTRSSSMANSQSSISISGHQQHQKAVLPVYPQQQQKPTMMIPLSLDVAQGAGVGEGVGSMSSNASQTCSSINSSQPQSLLSIDSANHLAIGSQQQQLNVQVNNISPCLSQRSCATSNTTSSSGVCCDGDGTNSVDDHHHHHHHQHQHNHQQQALAQSQVKLANSQSQHSNITVISINNAKTNNRGAFVDEMDASAGHVEQQQHANNNNDPDEEDDSRSSGSCSGSSSQGLYSIMSEERPLFVGSIVEAASDYQSGDPSHLQLKRGDRIEVLEYTSDLLQSGQMPRLANKPMLFGRRLADGQSGLFPSFCVHRTKYQSAAGLRQKLPLANITATNSTINHHQQSMHMASLNQQQQHTQSQQAGQNIRGNNLPQSQSMASLAISNNNSKPLVVQSQTVAEENSLKMKFKEIQVTLIKGCNEGFGFILRGAKIDPATLNGSNSGVRHNKLIIDENLMAANNLVSLQYLDDIESGSVAQKAGLKRGDFLVAVNGQDVRLISHEQVVQKIVQSGEQVHLTIATPVILNPSPAGHVTRTFSQKVKPEPPKRDPNTTLTRNKTQRPKSMLIQPISSLQRPKLLPDLFDANKPLPMAPSSDASGTSPTGSLNIMARSVSAHFHSSQSLSSSAATDTQSISSVSTISADQQHQPPQPHHVQQHQQQILPLQLQENTTSSLSSQQVTPTHSSSSTATLTTVAAVKPVAPPKPKFSATNNIYQPATITISKRTSPTSPPKTAQLPPMTQVPTHPQAPLPPPPPLATTASSSNSTAVPQPPPPPPLPDFSTKTPELSRSTLSQRRTSAPITPSLISDVSRLLKKRESLAFISNKPTVVATTAITAAPAPFAAVAAACAAAANSRLQRQQQKLEEQQQKQDNVGESGDKPAETNKLEEKLAESVKTIATDQANLQSGAAIGREVETVESTRPSQDELAEQESGAKLVVEQKQQRQINQLHHKQQIVADNVDDEPVCLHQKQRPSIVDEPTQKKHQHLSRQQASATLGRKSSAQIIQQPKQATAQLNQHSQTLRAKPTHQRPSLPQYDEMLPPPPPPLLEESWRRSSDAEHLVSQTSQPASRLVYQRPHQHHGQQHHQHQHHNQVPAVSECQQHPPPQAIYQPDVQVIAQKRQSQELIYQHQQQQQLYLLQQQQIIKQQRLQQQQMKLQQQLQQQHRLCLDSLPHEHHHGHAMALDHHHLQQQQQLQQRRCIEAESARSHHSHHHHHHHGHNHDHHLHDHYQTQMAPQQQQPTPALLMQPCVLANSTRLTSATQHQLHPQPNHYSQHQVLQQQQQQYRLHNHHQPQQQQHQHQQLLLQSQRNHHHHRHHQHYN